MNVCVDESKSAVADESGEGRREIDENATSVREKLNGKTSWSDKKMPKSEMNVGFVESGANPASIAGQIDEKRATVIERFECNDVGSIETLDDVRNDSRANDELATRLRRRHVDKKTQGDDENRRPIDVVAETVHNAIVRF